MLAQFPGFPAESNDQTWVPITLNFVQLGKLEVNVSSNNGSTLGPFNLTSFKDLIMNWKVLPNLVNTPLSFPFPEGIAAEAKVAY